MINNLWWAKENFDWSNIGVEVITRPTEIEALSNLAKQASYFSKIGFNPDDLKLTDTERKVFLLELKVTKEDFDTKDLSGVYFKDSYVRRVSKLSGYSEPFVMGILKAISRKSYLAEMFGVDIFAKRETKSEYQKRLMLTKKWINYRKNYKRIA